MEIRDVLPKDAIPSIDSPSFGDEYIGGADDRLVVLDADPPRGYPVRILNFHEIVNDTVAGESRAITWCPLCGSAIVYDRRVAGRTLTFGVSGSLADDDLVMYDRETESLWKQSLGRCIEGQLEGERLRALPAALLTWEAFTTQYPDGQVLQPPHTESEAASETDEPAPVDYDETPYRAYLESDGFGLAAHRGERTRQWNRTDIGPKTVVLGVELDGEAVGYPAPLVRRRNCLTDTVGGTEILILSNDEPHAFLRPEFEITFRDGAFHGDGTVWNPVTGRSEDGRQLDRVPTRRLFAFTWQDDHGPDAFYLDATSA